MLSRYFTEFFHILNDSAWLLLGGFAVAGVLHVVIQNRDNLLRPLTRPGFSSVVWATLLGAPLPLCSCSVLPTATSLLRKGARKGATSAFLITVPETDVVSIMLTYGLIGPVMAIVRPVSSVVTGLLTGWAVDMADRSESESSQPATNSLDTAEVPSCCASKPQPLAMATPAEPSCCASKSPPVAKLKPWWVRSLHYGFVEFFDDLGGRILIGLLIGAAVATALPSLDPGWLASHQWLSYLVLLGIGVPMYVCATASTPIAAGLIAGGVSPGAALVFLLVGPATNTAGLIVLAREFGKRVLAVHLVGVMAVSVAMGLALDAYLGSSQLVVSVTDAHRHGASILAMAGSAAYLILTASSYIRRNKRF